MPSQFVSAVIRPVDGTIDPARMGSGEPGMPREFRWGSRTIKVAGVRKSWRETGPCRHGSREKYVRKHWFEVVTEAGETMTIYFERQARPGQHRSRWTLYSIDRSLS